MALFKLFYFFWYLVFGEICSPPHFDEWQDLGAPPPP